MLGGAVVEADPERARALFRESVEFGRTAGMDFTPAMTLARLARMGTGSMDTVWARSFATALDLSEEAGDRADALRNASTVL